MANNCPIGFDAQRLPEGVEASRRPLRPGARPCVEHDNVYCVFLAESAEVMEGHARRTGFPAHRIERVHGMIDPACTPD